MRRTPPTPEPYEKHEEACQQPLRAQWTTRNWGGGTSVLWPPGTEMSSNLNELGSRFILKVSRGEGAPGWLSSQASAFGSGRDPEVLGSSSSSGSPQGAHLSSTYVSASVSLMKNK